MTTAESERNFSTLKGLDHHMQLHGPENVKSIGHAVIPASLHPDNARL
jgi:hypothetical protein